MRNKIFNDFADAIRQEPEYKSASGESVLETALEFCDEFKQSWDNRESARNRTFKTYDEIFDELREDYLFQPGGPVARLAEERDPEFRQMLTGWDETWEGKD